MKLFMYMNKQKQRMHLSLEQVMVTVSLGEREAMCCSRSVETVRDSAFQSEFVFGVPSSVEKLHSAGGPV